MRFIDANIFLRHLTCDDPEKAEACFALFQRAERNEVALTTSESVIAEVVHVLASKRLYNLSSEEIRSLVYPLLSIRGLKLPRRRTFLRALDLYAGSALDYEDALAVAWMERQRVTEIYSYDGRFDRVIGVKRLEP